MPMGLSTEGFSKRLVSRRSHVSKLVAVYTWVPRTLTDENVRTGIVILYPKSISNGKCYIKEPNEENSFLNSTNIAFLLYEFQW
jgi:hypothetical protein